MVLSKVPGVIYICFQDETWCIFFWGGINAQVLDALPVTSNSVQTRNKNPSTEIPTTYNHTLASPFNGPLPDTRRKGTALSVVALQHQCWNIQYLCWYCRMSFFALRYFFSINAVSDLSRFSISEYSAFDISNSSWKYIYHLIDR